MVDCSVATPCNGVCTLDPHDNVCIGCFRTNIEIAEWRASNDERRREILQFAEKRKAARS